MAKYEHDMRSAQVQDEHESGAHDGEQYKLSSWYCGFCEDEIDFAVDNAFGDKY
jgi:hypothetical protein